MLFKKETSTYTLSVRGMMCQHCAARVTDAVSQTRGARAAIDLAAGTVTVTCPKSADIAKIAADITAAGYPAEVQK